MHVDLAIQISWLRDIEAASTRALLFGTGCGALLGVLLYGAERRPDPASMEMPLNSLRSAFSACDANSDGLLDWHEVASFVQAVDENFMLPQLSAFPSSPSCTPLVIAIAFVLCIYISAICTTARASQTTSDMQQSEPGDEAEHSLSTVTGECEGESDDEFCDVLPSPEDCSSVDQVGLASVQVEPVDLDQMGYIADRGGISWQTAEEEARATCELSARAAGLITDGGGVPGLRGVDSTFMLQQTTLVRYLRAHKGDIVGALDGWRHTAEWRAAAKPWLAECHHCRAAPATHTLRQVGRHIRN
eukprot:SAG11_NODE_88_length_17244_cov_17.187460_10_plen_303_part_00